MSRLVLVLFAALLACLLVSAHAKPWGWGGGDDDSFSRSGGASAGHHKHYSSASAAAASGAANAAAKDTSGGRWTDRFTGSSGDSMGGGVKVYDGDRVDVGLGGGTNGKKDWGVGVGVDINF